MYIHTLVCFCESRRRFSSLLSLKYISYLFFCLSDLSLLPACCCMFRGCRAVCPLSIGHAPKLSGGLPSCLLCLVVLWWLPLLVHRQAQNSVTVWADAACICPRPFVLLPMCCRVSRCPFRVFRPSVRVCVLLPCVVWW